LAAKLIRLKCGRHAWQLMIADVHPESI
jgi:hypothetical protein